MRRTWVEITCDACSCACHYAPGDVVREARAEGWVITRDGKHYCDKRCYSKRKKDR